MPKFRFEKAFRSEIYIVAPLINEVLKFVNDNIPFISLEGETDLRLILSELLFNAVIHGNECDACKTVHISVVVEGRDVYCIILDEGQGFDYFTLFEKLRAEDDLYCEHGRGIRIAASLTDSLTYNLAGNQIKFHKRMAADG